MTFSSDQSPREEPEGALGAWVVLDETVTGCKTGTLGLCEGLLIIAALSMLI